MERFNIPVALFIFKRRNTLKSIIERISTVKPTKIYIIADGPRNEDEKEEVLGILGGKVAVSAEPSECKPKSASSPYSDEEIDDMFLM